MKKIFNWIIHSLYILILMILSIYLFWTGYAKDYVENHIKQTYGYAIKETYNNSELIKDLLNDDIRKQTAKKN